MKKIKNSLKIILLLLFMIKDPVAVKAQCLLFIYRLPLPSCQLLCEYAAIVLSIMAKHTWKEKRPAKGKVVCRFPADVQVLKEKAGFRALLKG